MQTLYSHYSDRHKKRLFVHLKNVAENSCKIIRNKDLNLTIIDQDKLAELSYLIGVVHDFAKSTTFFQDYLINGESEGPSHHGLLSAILAYLLVKKKYDEKFAIIAYMVVKRHHGNIESPIEESGETYFHTKYQIQNIKDNSLDQVEEIYNKLFTNGEYDINILLNELEVFVEKEDSLAEFFRIKVLQDMFNDDEKSIELFLISNLLYSVLIDVDKKDAARLNNDYFQGATKKVLNVEDYIGNCRLKAPDKFDKSKPINKERDNFLNDVIDNESLKKDNYLYTLTAPTGIGKTFTSFAFANKIRNFSTKGKRIIYCLPYTSIIDQNYAEFEKIIKYNLKEIYEEKPTKFLLRHHYLTPMQIKEDISLQNDSKNSRSLDSYLDDKLLLESWESGNIVTTFVQLLESIIGNKNSYLKKFHNIVNSIIILDEVQNIPVEYYNIVGKVIRILGTRFKTNILLMTATQPEMIAGKEVVDLVGDKYSKKEIFDRVNLNIINDLNPYTIEQFIEYLKSEFNSINILIVCNTIASALKVYNCVKNIFKDYKVYSLTTNLIPQDREKRIKEINNKIKTGEKLILVSTQLIEAGVDLSFEEVYRDFGPLDSLLQVAGRCNRSGELSKKGEVNIITLEDDKGNNFCNKIYDKNLLDICKEVLEENMNFSDLSKRYFDKIRKEYQRTGNKILNAIYELNYSMEKTDQTPIKEFKLIKEQYGKEDLVICKNKDVENEIEKLKVIYEKIKKVYNREELNVLITKKELINKELARYKISVYTNDLNKYEDIIERFRFIKYVSYDNQKKYLYDEKSGFLKEPKNKLKSSIII